MKKQVNRFIESLKKLFKIINKPEMKILPGQLAFFMAMSIFPVIALIGLIASSFNISIDMLVNMMQKTLPTEVSNTLIPFITGNGLDLTISFSMVIGFIFASNGAYSLIITSNELYGIDSSNYIKRRIKAFLLTILLVVFIIFVVIVLAFGNKIINFITGLGFLKSIISPIKTIYSILKIPVAILIIFFIIKLIYVFAPDKKIPGKCTTKGTLFTTFGVIAITLIYSYYVANFSNYNIFYGSLTNIVVMMMWIYLISYIIVIGISINTNSYNLEKNE